MDGYLLKGFSIFFLCIRGKAEEEAKAIRSFNSWTTMFLFKGRHQNGNYYFAQHTSLLKKSWSNWWIISQTVRLLISYGLIALHCWNCPIIDSACSRSLATWAKTVQGGFVWIVLPGLCHFIYCSYANRKRVFNGFKILYKNHEWKWLGYVPNHCGTI